MCVHCKGYFQDQVASRSEALLMHCQQGTGGLQASYNQTALRYLLSLQRPPLNLRTLNTPFTGAGALREGVGST